MPDEPFVAEGTTDDRGASHHTKRVTAPTFPNLDSALAFLENRINVERMRPTSLPADVFQLDRMRALMRALGDPQSSLRMVHVAGSKGKGSTCEMVAACLEGCGYTVGLYTSPHLVSILERIRVGGRNISAHEFTSMLERVAAAGAEIAAEHGEATFFELLTAAAFVHYAEQAVDIAVIEVGLGGRLDSTNIITPEVCAITSIQLEHTQILGDTHEKIAREKAGIMKPGVPCITHAQKPGVLEVFKEVAEGVGAPLFVLGQNVEFTSRFEASPELGPHARVCLSSARSNFEHLPVPLKGEHQALNCGLALAILDKLRERGFETSERKVAQGLAKTPNIGRVELVWNNPRVIVDGAHTPESVEALIKALGSHMKSDSMVIIFGCAADKQIPGMLAKLARGADKIIFTKAANNLRSVDPRELSKRFGDVSSKMAQVASSFEEAIQLARRAVGRDDLICVTGSFYLAGEAKKYCQARTAKGLPLA
jgi:dihydrofolate synthase / folylpolyglutamate synthase